MEEDVTTNKNDKVLSVRLSAKEVERLESISEQWDISVSSLVRSFISSCLYSLPSVVTDRIEHKQTKATKKVRTVKRKIPDKDSETEARTQQEEKASLAESSPKISRNEPCPCGALYPDGRHKKYKDCCGK